MSELAHSPGVLLRLDPRLPALGPLDRKFHREHHPPFAAVSWAGNSPLRSIMMDDEDLQRVYQWVDDIPLSRPKRNIARDFCDGVLTAEIVAHYFPKIVELHSYPAANSFSQKSYNWATLNQKVFKKMAFQLTKEEIEALSNCMPQAVERMLKKLQNAMAKYGARKQDDEPSTARGQPSARTEYQPPPPKPVAAPKAPGAARASGGGAVRASGSSAPTGGSPSAADESLHAQLAEKDAQLSELAETVDILEVKIQKLEQLVRLKDSKIATLQAKLSQFEGR